MKRLIVFAVLFFSSFALADETGFGQLSLSCSQVTTTGACTTYNVHPPDFIHVPQANSFTWQTIFSGGTPTSVTILLQGSIDGTTFSTIDTSTSTAGETRTKAGTAYSFFRCNVTAYNRNGTSASCQITPQFVQGGGGSSAVDSVNGQTGTVVLGASDVGAIATGGNAGTATALAANGANCSAGQAPLGVDASGAVEGCYTVDSQPINQQTGTSYTIQASDAHSLVRFNNASPVAVTLPQAGVTFPAGWYVVLKNAGAGLVTVTPTTSTINGVATLTLPGVNTVRIVSDGTNYFSESYSGASSFAAHTFYGNSTGSSAAPYAQAIAEADVTSLVSDLAAKAPLSAPSFTTSLGSSGPGTFSAAGAASTPGLKVTGVPYTAGTGTTNFPQTYLNAGASGPTTFSTAGTLLGGNAPSGFTGNLLDFHINGGSSVFAVSYQGAIQAPITCSITSFSFIGDANTGFCDNSTGTIIWRANNFNILTVETSGSWYYNGQILGFKSSGFSNDTGFSRNAAGVIQAGTSTANSQGKLLASAFMSGGTKFTASGCSNGTTVGGGSVGKFSTGASGTCAVTITMGDSATAPNGWACYASDQTTAVGNPIYQSGGSTTTAVLTLPAGNLSGDVISFGCKGY